MSVLPYYKAFPRDFIEGTLGMDFETKAAYRLVLDLIYMQGGRLPDDARYISGVLGLTVKRWNIIRERLITMDKIYKKGEFLSNYRADKVIETARKFQQKQSENRSTPNKNNNLQSPTCDHLRDNQNHINILSSDNISNGKPERKKGSRLSSDWKAPEDWIEWAVSESGAPARRILSEAEKFKDYWIAKSGSSAVKMDWMATWRNWIRRAFEKKTVKNNSSGVDYIETAREIMKERHDEFSENIKKSSSFDFG